MVWTLEQVKLRLRTDDSAYLVYELGFPCGDRKADRVVFRDSQDREIGLLDRQTIDQLARERVVIAQPYNALEASYRYVQA